MQILTLGFIDFGNGWDVGFHAFTGNGLNNPEQRMFLLISLIVIMTVTVINSV